MKSFSQCVQFPHLLVSHPSNPTDCRAVMSHLQPHIVVSDGLTLTCVLDQASEWRYMWFNGSNSVPFSKTVVNSIAVSVEEGLYRCQGERAPNLTSVSNPVLVKG